MRPIKPFFLLPAVTGLALSAPAQSFLTNGLVADFPLDGNANDLSGNGNNGTPYAVTAVSDRFGTDGGAYQLNGSNSVISVASLSSNNLTALTLSVWIMPLAAPTIAASHQQTRFP